MIKHSVAFHITSLIASFTILTSCSPQHPTDPERENVPINTAISPQNEIETLTPSSTVLPLDAAVPTPTLTKWPTQPITLENVSSLKEINRWGRGTIIRVQKLDNKGE